MSSFNYERCDSNVLLKRMFKSLSDNLKIEVNNDEKE